MIMYREISWWYGVVTVGLHIAEPAGSHTGFYVGISLTAIQVATH
jgi:hypothetical protein